MDDRQSDEVCDIVPKIYANHKKLFDHFSFLHTSYEAKNYMM